MCRCMFPFVVNVRLQYLQLNGRSPVCTRTWRSKDEADERTFEQMRHVNEVPSSDESRMLLWLRIWLVKSCWVLETVSQIGQTYFVSSAVFDVSFSLPKFSVLSRLAFRFSSELELLFLFAVRIFFCNILSINWRKLSRLTIASLSWKLFLSLLVSFPFLLHVLLFK